MPALERTSARDLKARVRPEIAAVARRVTEENREALALLEAYDRLPDEQKPRSSKPE